MSNKILHKCVKLVQPSSDYTKGKLFVVGVWSCVDYIKLDVTTGDGVIFSVDASKVVYLNNRRVKL